MVVEVEMKRHTVDVEEVHIVLVLVPMRGLGGSPNWGCKHFHMVHFMGEPRRRVHSPMEGFYSPS